MHNTSIHVLLVPRRSTWAWIYPKFLCFMQLPRPRWRGLLVSMPGLSSLRSIALVCHLLVILR
jgi:hypothetical protein